MASSRSDGRVVDIDTADAGFYDIAGERRVARLGFGAMQLARPSVSSRDATAVLEAAVHAGVNHIDTSDYYGRHVVNDAIRAALAPYPPDLLLATKVGYALEAGGLRVADARDQLIRGVHDNLAHLGVDTLELVYLRVPRPSDQDAEAISRPFAVLAELRNDGLIRHLGVSNVGCAQLAAAQRIAPVVAVQNQYSRAYRDDDALVDLCARTGIAYVPYGPLAGASARAGHTRRAGTGEKPSEAQHALAWLLRRSSNILLIPGTASVVHLQENLAVVSH